MKLNCDKNLKFILLLNFCHIPNFKFAFNPKSSSNLVPNSRQTSIYQIVEWDILDQQQIVTPFIKLMTKLQIVEFGTN